MAGHVAHLEETRNAYTISIGNPEGKLLLRMRGNNEVNIIGALLFSQKLCRQIAS
jgi:hypothetical protein